MTNSLKLPVASLLGDTGSVFDIGRLAINEIFLRGKLNEATPVLLQSLSDLFGTNDRDQVLAKIYQSDSPAARIAKLAPAVIFDFHSGKSYARYCVYKCIDAILQHLSDHRTNIGAFQNNWQVRLTGGLWKIDDIFYQLLIEKTTGDERFTNSQIKILETAPIEGAVRLAQKLK